MSKNNITENINHNVDFGAVLNYINLDIIYCDKKGTYLNVNENYKKHKNLKDEDIIGKNISDFFPDRAESIIKSNLKIINSGKPKLEIIEKKIDKITKKIKWIKIDKIPYKNVNQEIIGIIILIHDITKLKEAEEAIKKSLEEKDSLIKEIHHRVKNNLQIISSLLAIQSNYIKDKKTLEIFNDTRSRILTMALIHNKLYQSNNFSKIDMSNFIKDLNHQIYNAYYDESKSIQFKLQTEPILLDIDISIPLGLILNEIISNSLKYGFIDKKTGQIFVSFANVLDNGNETNKYILIVRDNGYGFPEGFDYNKSETLGLKLIFSLTRQINGVIKVNNNNGVEYEITFTLKDS